MAITATLSEVKQIVSDGRFFTVTFKKVSTGDVRVMNGRVGVRKGVNLNSNTAPSDLVVKVYEVAGGTKGQWRSVRPDSIMQIVANKTVYDFANRAPEESFIRDVFRKGDYLFIKIFSKAKNKILTYRADGVPLETMKEFAVAESRGTFFNTVIKPNYHISRVV